MTHVKALQAGHSSQGTSEPITPVSKEIFIMCVSGVIMLIIVCLSSLEDISSCPQLSLDLSLSVTFRTMEGVTGSIYYTYYVVQHLVDNG